MFNINEKENTIIFNLSTDMRLVDRVASESMEFVKMHVDAADVAEFKLVIRELLVNAIEHGNKKIIGRTVYCLVEHLGQTRFKVLVEDQGEGFDYRNLDLILPKDPRTIRNRGYALINSFSDEIRWNESGNSVTAYITLSIKTVFNSGVEDGFLVIRPEGDITASIVGNFRSFLEENVEKGFTKFRFDLEDVRDVDSVGLSVFVALSNILERGSNDFCLEIVHANEDLINFFRMTKLDEFYGFPNG